jgi:hypothetical protein
MAVRTFHLGAAACVMSNRRAIGVGARSAKKRSGATHGWEARARGATDLKGNAQLWVFSETSNKFSDFQLR